MALVGHISGSSQSQSVIGVTGSVVFANQPAASFPAITSVGSDVVFFVSGTVGGKNVAGQKTVAVFGGDAVVSGSLTVGSGSVKITSNDIQFSSIGSRIQLDGNDLKFFDLTNPSGFTLASLGSGGGGAGADSAASYIVVGLTGSLPNDRALTGGTGILTSDGGAGSNFTLAINDSVVATVSGTNFTGGVTGTTLSMSGDITGSSLRLTGGQITTAQTTFSLVDTTATTVNFARAATALNVGNSAGVVAVAGGLTAGGGYDDTGVTLSAAGNVRANGFLQVDGLTALTGSVTLAGNSQTVTHTGTGNLTIASTGGSVLVEGTTFTTNDVTVAGDLAVNGGDLTTTSATFNLLNSVTTLNVGTSATTVNIGQASNETNIGGNLTVNGNLTVSGDVVAVDATHLRVEDRVVLIASGGSPGGNRVSAIGFASGSASGIASLIVGPVGSSDAVGFAKQDIRDGTLAASSLSFAELIPVKASRFDAGYAGTAFLTSSEGTDATLKATAGAVILDGTANNGTGFYIAGTPYAALTDNVSSEAQFGAVGGKNLNLSGSQVIQNAGIGGSRFYLHGTEFARLSAATTTAPIFRASQSNATLTLGTNGGGTDFLVLSGTTIRSNSGISGFFFQRNGVNHLNVLGGAATTLLAVDGTSAPINLILSGAQNTISSNGGTTQFAFAGQNAFSAQGDAVSLSLVSAAGRATANVFNTVSTTVNFAGAASTALNIGNASGLTTMQGTVSMAGSLGVVGLTSLSGSVVLGDTSGDNVTFTGRVNSNLLPSADIQFDLGSPTNRWANMYTGDLHLRNERGDWTIIEESDFLTITNNKNGKRYKFVLEEIG